jgi:hypothetical protein
MSDSNINTGCLSKYFTSSDTYISITGSGSTDIIAASNSWNEYENLLLNQYNFIGNYTGEAGLVLSLNEIDEKDYYVNYRINKLLNNNFDLFNKNKQYLKIKQFKPKNIGYPVLYKEDEAWASYDVTTGANSKSVFSYAINLVEKMVLDGLIFTGSGSEYDTSSGILNLLREKEPPQIFTGIDSYFSNYQTICKATVDCGDQNNKDPEPKVFCWTGMDTNGTDFDNWLEKQLSGLRDEALPRQDSETSLEYLTTRSVSQYFLVKTGYILYNSWVSGDSLSWNLYDYDYINVYKNYHLNNLPPFPNTGFTLKYLIDWNSITTLVDKLNEKLETINYPVWYPYQCLRDTSTGIYITGGLMKFYRENTGSAEYDNRINFTSLHTLPEIITGDINLSQNVYNFKLSLQEDREQAIIQKYSGYSYLLPDTIQLEGYNLQNQEWTILDSRTGLLELFEQEDNGEPLIERRYRSVFPELDNPSITNEELYPPPEPEEEDLLKDLENLKADCSLLSFSRRLVKKTKPLCPSQIQSQEITFVHPSNCPSFIISGGKKVNVDNRYWCRQDSSDDGKGIGEERGDEGGGGGGSGITKPIPKGIYTIIRTGWNLTGVNGLNSINTEYDKYRVKLINFRGNNFEGHIPKNNFLVENINLFGIKDAPIEPHFAGSQCLLGANYYIDVVGEIPIAITGKYNYTITPQMSGYYQFNQTPFVRKIEENEKAIKFNKISGRIISESGTGYLTLTLTGSGLMSYSNDDYYFYDPINQEVYFEEKIIGNLYGSGYLSGQATTIKQSVINKELLVGGRFSTNVSYATITKNDYFSGVLENIPYTAYDLTGLYKITGIVTGTSASGYLNINKLVSGNPDYIQNQPYYPFPTGFRNATGFLIIDFNNIKDFDYLSINNQEIFFNNDNISYLAPIYFNTSEVLIDTINDNPLLFLVKAYSGNNNIIYLDSLLSGESGNNIRLYSSNLNSILFNGNYLTSGKNYYPSLTKPSFININDDYYFSGILNKQVGATGFYIDYNYGYLTGIINTFKGFRHFYNIWNISTGLALDSLVSFKNIDNNYINSGIFSKDKINNLIFNIGYSNNKKIATEDNLDLVEIKINDLNNINNSGIYFRISGKNS